MGKSAQILLHTWLPDAMEGPTPVSALIHAATMVTAGIFLVVRCSPIYEYSPLILNFITIVGMTTAFFAATVALVQTDIKKIIAYSTCSQLGYMFFAAGVGAYNVAMFHLFTHAFFKALLFLGSGSVIHAFKDEQDINNMGGVWKKLPYTYALMIIGTLALTGFPFLSGCWIGRPKQKNRALICRNQRVLGIRLLEDDQPLLKRMSHFAHQAYQLLTVVGFLLRLLFWTSDLLDS
jgi:NADH-quinone oxidoreductase subunit L